MIQSLSDILVISDMDGTLLADDKSIPLANVETIRLFTAMGGRFSIATGRVSNAISMYPAIVPCLSPVISSGGCVIHDFERGINLKSVLVPRVVARQVVRDFATHFPEYGAVVMNADGHIYQLSTSKYTSKLMSDERHTYFVRPVEDVPPDWNKVLFAGPNDRMDAITEYTRERHYPGVYFVETDPNYFEMMPQDVSKGNALRELCGLMDVDIKNCYAVGDYFNDIDMMEQAGHSVAVANAPRDIQLVADEITASNNEGGVGQFLYGLIRRYGE